MLPKISTASQINFRTTSFLTFGLTGLAYFDYKDVACKCAVKLRIPMASFKWFQMAVDGVGAFA